MGFDFKERFVPRVGRFSKKQVLLLFSACVFIYALVSFDRVMAPSGHIHFVDLAESFLDGRLDTDTPRKRCGNGKPRKGDPAGFRKFICTHLTDAKGKAIGFNDWASFHDITLKDGTELRGVWPWDDGNVRGSDRHLFRSLDGDVYLVNRDRKNKGAFDLKTGCGGGSRACDKRTYYMSFPPMPAIVMMPFVTIFHYNFNDVLFTLLMAAASAMALLAILEKLVRLGRSARSQRDNLLIAILFSFGTSVFFSSVRGEVWFTALILGYFFHLLYIYAALGARHPVWAGLMLAFGMATRTPIAFASVFFAFELFRLPDWPTRIRAGLKFSMPVLAVGILLIMYNIARFGSATEFGHTYLMDGQRPSIREWGLFHPHFLAGNLKAAFTNLPELSTSYPYMKVSRHGLSLLVASPALLYVFWPKRWTQGMTAALVALICVGTPALFYQNTGWAQFSYRFSIDYLPYFAILLACGGRNFGRTFYVLLTISVLMGLFGAITFGRFEQFYFG
jgi:hypothetical protein